MAGAVGRTFVNGVEIPGKDSRRLAAGDVVRNETPGGGGFGAAKALGLPDVGRRWP
jgi:N-methylhydantoinase B/oxoprolinase/acetone carboxylase alpha subunit